MKIGEIVPHFMEEVRDFIKAVSGGNLMVLSSVIEVQGAYDGDSPTTMLILTLQPTFGYHAKAESVDDWMTREAYKIVESSVKTFCRTRHEVSVFVRLKLTEPLAALHPSLKQHKEFLKQAKCVSPATTWDDVYGPVIWDLIENVKTETEDQF